jgi:hypothetical protein
MIHQVDLSGIQLPKIGTIIAMNADGKFQQGPIPGLGGPFDTVTEFFQAWATKNILGRPMTVSGPYMAYILTNLSLQSHRSRSQWLI